ncbi:hypothetical protein GCM10027589_52040 [Actinocorallia lasiicapitis]
MASVADAAYAQLPEQARRAYRLLALHPGTRPRFTEEAASALLGEDASGALDLLTGRHLLETHDGRYYFHDLVRVHALGCGRDNPEAVRRVVEYYLDHAVAADTTANPDRAADAFGPRYRHATPSGSAAAALAWLDAEHRHLAACVFVARRRGWDDLAWQLCEASWWLYFTFKYHDDWIATHRVGLEAAAGIPQAEFRVGIQLGRALNETGRFGEAREVLARALTAARALGAPAHEATAVEFLGRSHELAGDPVSALGYYERSLALERSVGRLRGVAINLHHRGRVLLALGRLDDASASLTEALELFEGLPRPDRYNTARVIHTFGRLRRACGLDAVPLLLRALELMEAENRPYQQAEILTELAGATGDPAYAARATALYTRLGVTPPG